MRVLVIGGTHFIGPYVVENLIQNNCQVTCFHRNRPHREMPQQIIEVIGDRNDPSCLESLDPEKFDVVLDMCCMTLLQAELTFNCFARNVRRYVLISSCDVYQAFGNLIGTEECPINNEPISEISELRKEWYPYRDGRTQDDWRYFYDKIPIEQFVMEQLTATVLRLPMVYGPYDKQKRMAAYLRRMVDNRDAIIVSENLRNFVSTRGFVKNISEGISLAVLNSKSKNQVFNIADNKIMSEEEWIKAIAKEANWQGNIVAVPNQKLPEAFQHLSTQNLIICTEKIRSMLGFLDAIDLKESIAQTVSYELDHLQEASELGIDYKTEDKILRMF